MRSINRVMKGVVSIVGAVIGLVVVADVIDSETYDPDDADDTGVISEDSIAGTVVSYIVPLLALAVLASGVAFYRLKR